jgi:hypothetical protein
MYADITLEIVILGGQSMTAPINRLQNALSFNYFANTEMYDVRADSLIFPEGIGFDEKNQEPFRAKILDGLRLSRITGGGNILANKNIENLRRQFRVANELQIAPFDGDGDLPTSFQTVPELLEIKRRLNLPLTEAEKAQLELWEYDANGNLIRKNGKPVEKVPTNSTVIRTSGETIVITPSGNTIINSEQNDVANPNSTFGGQPAVIDIGGAAPNEPIDPNQSPITIVDQTAQDVYDRVEALKQRLLTYGKFKIE